MADPRLIFVAIPSYRDVECIHTLDDLFAKAEQPENITVGICDQTTPTLRLVELLADRWYKDQVRLAESDAAESNGSGWAWVQAHSLRQGEKYTLNIHAHMRFVPRWDRKMLEQYALCPSSKPVLSCWCPPYRPPNDFYEAPDAVWRMSLYGVGRPTNAQLVHLEEKILSAEDAKHGIYPSPFVVFNFVFATSEVFEQLPLDPHIYFWGEEIAYSARLWTHGYDIFQPAETLAFHQWKYRETDNHFRPLEHPGNQKSYQRLCTLLNLQMDSNAQTVVGAEQDLEHYGLGSTRPIEDWFQYAGVDFANRTVEPYGKSGAWDLSVPKAPRALSSSEVLAGSNADKTIFIAIPSYLDRQCVPTIKRLFKAAARPDLVTVGVCWQADAAMGEFPMEDLAEYQDQVRITHCDIKDAKGANWARMEACKLAQGEDFVLMIDAHMYMVDGWDTQLLQAHQSLDDARAVLTYYCPHFDPPNKVTSGDYINRRVIAKRFGDAGDPQLLHLNREILQAGDVRMDVLYPSPFIVHHYIFAPRQAFEAVPIDPNIRFWGDELTLSLRLWTHGYSVYQLPKPLAFHQWFGREEGGELTYREIANPAAKENEQYIKMAIGLPHQSKQVVKPEYALGKVRSAAAFWQFSGVDMARRTIAPHGQNGLWDLTMLAGSQEKRLSTPVLAQSHLANSQNNATIRDPKTSSKQNPQDPMAAKDKSHKAILVCISANRHAPLAATLSSLMKGARTKDYVRISVAWDGQGEIAVPDGLDAYAAQIEIRYITSQMDSGNALHNALAGWRKEDYIAITQAGILFAEGWDDTLRAELGALPKQAVCTSIASHHPGRLKHICARLASPEYHALIIEPTMVQALDGTSNQTPLLSLNLLAGSSQNMLTCLPDPYISGPALELSLAARLWTHGVDIYHAKTSLVHNNNQPPLHPAPSDAMLTRAQHVLGLALSDNHEVLRELDGYGHGDAKTVESFWTAVGINLDKQTIHPKALKGEWEKLLADEIDLSGKPMRSYLGKKQDALAKPASFDSSGLRIFVQIASYRDEECQHTVKNLFAQAKYPDRVFVGICWQSIPEEDQDCFQVITRPEQVRVVHFDARESKGANWARVQAGKLRQGEDYVLMIDAHTRFERGWDETLIHMQQQLPTTKGVLSTYPTAYDPKTGVCKDDHILRMAYKEFIEKTTSGAPVVKYSSHRIGQSHYPKSPFLAGTLSSNFLFSTRQFFEEVPLDPYIYFFGDDLSLMVRAWTHGWDVYSPNIPVLYHLWDRKSRPSHWQDHNETNKLVAFTERRVAHLTGMHKLPQGAPPLKEIETYGLGSERHLRAFEAYAGVSFLNRVITDHAKRGVYDSSQLSMSPAAALTAESNPIQPFINPKKPLVMPKSGLIVPAASQASYRGPVKTLETKDMVVYDDFLPEDQFEKIYQHAVMSDYKHINTTGNVARVWNIDNGFPLRSSWNRFYRVPGIGKKTEHDYPNNKPTDAFFEQVLRIAPDVQSVIGAPGVHWSNFSNTSWLYPQNTGLSLHNDGSGVYSGAYVYYLNKEWRIHWGGLLMVLDASANEAMESHKVEHNPHIFHKGKWLNETEHNDYAMESGFARTIFPKRNRIVFIAPDAYHIVTKILPAAGDNVRMTLAGFFSRGPLGNKKAAAQQQEHPLAIQNKSLS